MLPDKQLLLDEVDGLASIPDSTLESIATAGLIEFLQGTPLNPSGTRQVLVTGANPLQCLKRQEVLGLFVRKLLDLFLSLASGGATSGLRQFDTVTDMLADPGSTWGTAVCLNYFVADGILTKWVRIIDSGKAPNGNNLLQAGDGFTILWRTELLENV